jgi:ABC-2 type transport system ATP-binding protein
VEVDAGGVTVRAVHPPKFFPKLNAVLAGGYGVRRLEPLDESTHAILGYLLGGSGKT